MSMQFGFCFIILLTLCGCYGEDSVSHLMLLDELPPSLLGHPSPHIEIRTNFSGEIELREADQFKVLLNITAPTIEEAYAVSSQLTENKGNLLVQVFQKPKAVTTYSLKWIFLAVGSAGGVVLTLTVMYVVWWYSSGKFHELYGERAFLAARHEYRSHNSVHLGATADLLGDHDNDDADGDNDYDRRRMEKMRVSMKPETIMEESEESADDDRTHPKYRLQPDVKKIQRQLSLRERAHQLSNENVHGSGYLDYPDQSADELDNDMSPDQIIAGADGNYTPLDELDDFLHHDQRHIQNSQSIAKLDPKGNLDYNIHASKSDGDLLGDHKKVSEREKLIIPPQHQQNFPLVLPPKTKRSPSRNISVPRRAEPNIYQRGLNLRSGENDLSSSPARSDKVQAQVHTPENQYSNNSFGQYMELKTPESVSKSRISRESNDAYEMYTYSADIPMSSFKAGNTISESHYQVPRKKPKPVINTSGSPTAFDFNTLEPHFNLSPMNPNEPYSPGKFSMLNEGEDTSEDGSEFDDDFDHSINRLEDSDIDDLPPSPVKGDADVMSNSSLPLPSPPDIGNQYMPYANMETVNISQRSPRQSLVTQLESKEYGTMIALTGSPSPGGPFSKHSVNRFVFPPNPTAFAEGLQTRRELNFPSEEMQKGEYVDLPMNVLSPPPMGNARGNSRQATDRKPSFGKRDRHKSTGEKDREREIARERRLSGSERERKQSGSERERKSSFGRKSGKPPKHLHLTVLTTMCVLSVMSGVYCLGNSGETTVNIVIYAPKSYSSHNFTVISHLKKDVKIKEAEFIQWFVSENPILQKFNSSLCDQALCEHKCDENTGKCICRHGYTKTSRGNCIDINECHTGMMQCPNPKSGCLNSEGSYECLCSEKSNLYRYRDQCLDCSDPCPPGRYEIQPCKRDPGWLPKICKECTESCGVNFYQVAPCTARRDMQCIKCQDPCNSTTEFEFQQCSPDQNRLCRDKKFLPKPGMTGNVVLDDHLNISGQQGQLNTRFSYSPTPGTQSSFLLKKGVDGLGSEIWVDIALRNTEHVMMFTAVDHSREFSAEDFRGHEDILEKYCPYPIPYQYELKFIKHNNVFYKGNTSKGLLTLKPCESQPDSFPNVTESKSNSIFCSQPGILSDVFHGINSEDYKMTNTVWEENDENCKRQHELCETCSKNCSKNMPLDTRAECRVSVNDDSGMSPRLASCYTCCMKDTCSNFCSAYHDMRCPMVKCQVGNLVQFQLVPFYQDSDTFYCHVEPSRNRRILTVEYSVMTGSDKHEFAKRKFDLVTDEDWVKTGKIRKGDDIIYIELDSLLQDQPNLVTVRRRGNGHTDIDVGRYQAFGQQLHTSLLSENTAFIRPNKPFGISKKLFVQKSCEETNLEDMVVAKDLRNPNAIIGSLDTVNIGNGTFQISHKIGSNGVVGMKQRASILKAIFDETKVEVEASMTNNGTHWMLFVTGVVEKCPGVFSLNVSDPRYLPAPMYIFDVAVQCPRRFGLNFTIPTGDGRTLSHDMQLQVRDKQGTNIIVVHSVGLQEDYSDLTSHIEVTTKPPDNTEDHLTTEKSQSDQKEPRHFSVLFIAIVSGVIILLLLLLCFGVAWKQGIPEGDIMRFHVRHLVLLVVYITFQCVYSFLVSMTVFVMIVRAVNVDTTTFLRQYNQQRSVTSALSQLELDGMEAHLMVELKRQDGLAVERKQNCYGVIRNVIEDVEKLRQSLETRSINTLQRQNLKKLITDHSKVTRDMFSQDLLELRRKYSKYEAYILHKLKTEMNSTYHSISNSKWLQGAQFLYRYVEINKDLMGEKDLVPWMTWVDMQTDMLSLAEGLTLPLPDLPVVPDLTSSQSTVVTPQSLGQKSSLLATQVVNKWFMQPDHTWTRSNRTKYSTDGNTKKVTTFDVSSYSVFVVGMVIIDLLWLTHRMVKACGIGKLILYGYPVYVDARDKKDEKKINSKSLMKIIRGMMRKMVNTMFIPKLIGALFVILMVYFVSLCAYKFVNRKTFGMLGYHNDMENIMKINQAVINSRINSHAERINNLEFKMYEEVMNVNIQNHQYVLNLIETQWSGIERAHTKMYCDYLRRIDVTASCHGDSGEATLTEVRPDRCSFAPVLPNLYKRNATEAVKVAGAQLDGFLFNIRKLVSDTCYVIIIYLSAVVIKELLSTVLWIYVKRSGFMSLRIIYETDEAPGSADSSTTYHDNARHGVITRLT